MLKRVVALREQEQELANAERTPREMFGVHRCRVCGKQLNAQQDGKPMHTVCSRCGGRKRQMKLEREDARRTKEEGDHE